MSRRTTLFIVCAFEIAMLLFAVVSSAQTEGLEATSGLTLGNVGKNRLHNFIKKQTNPLVSRRGYGTAVSLNVLEQKLDNRGVRCSTKWCHARANTE